jgi:cysteine-rich repeat protein
MRPLVDLRSLAVLAALAASACVTPAEVTCDDDSVCPAGYRCVAGAADEGEAIRCEPEERFAVCDGAAEGAGCTVLGAFNGECHAGACLEVTCGNTVTQGGEACDDGNRVSGDGCDEFCLSTEVCGNGFRDPGEQCDEGAANADTPDAPCRLACRQPTCGDGVTDPARGETCDDGNQEPGDGCTFACIVESCGNGVVDFFAGEQCDEGDGVNSDAPDATCRTTCLLPRCGDGVVDPGRFEQCDDGVANSDAPNAGCRLGCDLPTCGDGVLDDALGEVCDDGNGASGDGCRADCASDEVCGNGIVDPFTGEVCDDGNGWRHDGCSACLPETAAWTRPNATAGPRVAACAAYDAQRGVFVAFGGRTGTGYSSETWELRESTWRPRASAIAPGARAECTMGYDAARGVIVMIGGVGETGIQLSDTWEWNGEAWRQAAAFGPNGYRKTMTYHGRLRGLILWSPWPGNSTASLYRWTGTDWAYLGEGPDARSYPTLAYDPVRDRLVLGPGGNNLTTWEWDGTSWTQATPVTSPASAFSGVGWYSTAVGHVLMHVGDGNVWSWDGTTWTATPSPTSFGGRWYGLGVAIDHDVAIVDASTYTLDALGGTGWHARTLLAPPARLYAADTWAAERGEYLVFGGLAGGVESADLFIRRRGEWSAEAPAGAWPPARQRAVLAHDPLRRRTVLFGGWNGTAALADLWEWDGAAWHQVDAGGAPAWPLPTTDAAMIFAPTLGEVMLIGGRGSLGTDVRSAVWSWNGTVWTARTALPVAVAANAVAWDPYAGEAVMAAGYDPSWGGQRLSNTYAWRGSTWDYRTTHYIDTPMRFYSTTTYDPMRRRPVMLGGFGYGSIWLDDTWEWNTEMARWQLAHAAGPVTFGHSAHFDPEAAELVVLSHQGADLGEWRLRRDSTVPEESCAVGADGDDDGLSGCDDPDCWWTCTPLCPPETACDAALPACGDGVCDPIEGCTRCPSDCGACASACGDFECAGDEDAAACPGDCAP